MSKIIIFYINANNRVKFYLYFARGKFLLKIRKF